MRLKGNKTNFIDYIFWIIFIFYTNPGGIFMALGEDSGDGGANVTDFLFVFLFLCYVIIYHKRDRKKTKTYNKILNYLVVFFIYHFVVFAYLIPIFKETANFSLSFLIIKNRRELMSFILFFMIYEFYIRSYIIFFKLLIISSIIVIVIFLITFVTGVEILPIEKVSRGFINIDRVFLTNYGLMPLVIPLGAVLIAFKIRIKWRNILLIGFGLMFLTWLLSLTRRHIIGTLMYLFLAFVLNNYSLKKALIPYNRIFTFVFYTGIIFLLINFTFPKYIDAGIETVDQAIYVVQHGETTTGRKDVRLGLGKNFMQNLIKENFVLGTGFDNRWRTLEGDKAGYETSDYPFLSAIAMKGIIGVLIFLPVYVLLVKSLIFDLKFIRKYSVNFNNKECLVLILFIVYFIYDLMNYMSWFYPVSMTRSYKWFVLLAMYLGSRHIFYSNYFIKNRLINNKLI